MGRPEVTTVFRALWLPWRSYRVVLLAFSFKINSLAFFQGSGRDFTLGESPESLFSDHSLSLTPSHSYISSQMLASSCHWQLEPFPYRLRHGSRYNDCFSIRPGLPERQRPCFPLTKLDLRVLPSPGRRIRQVRARHFSF